MKVWKLTVIATALLLSPVSSAVVLAQTQAAMNGEACAESTKADAELNAIYQQVLRERQSDALFVRKMKAAQRAWITYRDTHLAALYPAADPRREYGSAYPVCRCTALAEATRKRTEELRRWTGRTTEGDVCAGSTRARTEVGVLSRVAEHESANSVFRKRWTLIAMGDRSFTTNAPYLEFNVKQGRVSGSSGCNRITGGYHVDGNDLRISPVGGTRMACPGEEAQAVEASFLKALKVTSRFEVQDNVLSLYAGGSPVLTFSVGAAEAGGAAEKASVTGAVMYLQRIALSPEAVMEVKLVDVSRADAPAETLAEQRITSPGQVPVKFEISYDPSKIDPRHTYAVQARITEGGRLRFISTRSYPVITRGNPNTIEIRVDPAK